jgi:hypothetical protein
MAFAHAQVVPSGTHEIRVGSDGWTFGKPYDWCCTAKPAGGGVVELSLVTAPPTRGQARALVRLLRSLGYRQILARRVADGRERLVAHVLSKPMDRGDSNGNGWRPSPRMLRAYGGVFRERS